MLAGERWFCGFFLLKIYGAMGGLSFIGLLEFPRLGLVSARSVIQSVESRNYPVSVSIWAGCLSAFRLCFIDLLLSVCLRSFGSCYLCIVNINSVNCLRFAFLIWQYVHKLCG
jgi:hypothetical protein